MFVFSDLYWRAALFWVFFWIIFCIIFTLTDPLSFDLVGLNFEMPKIGISFVEEWLSTSSFEGRLVVLVKNQGHRLITGLIVIYLIGVVFRFGFSFSFYLGLGFVFGLAFGLTWSTAFGLGYALSLGLLGDYGNKSVFTFGERKITVSYRPISARWSYMLVSFIFFGFLGFFTFVIYGGVSFGLICGFCFLVFCAIVFSKTWILPVYFFKAKEYTLARNPIIFDEISFLPLRKIDEKLINEARRIPEKAELFISFLLENRPHWQILAMRLRHSSIGGIWYEQSFQHSNSFDADKLKMPVIVDNLKEYQPYERWEASLIEVRAKLINFQQQTDARLRQRSFEAFLKSLATFKKINLAASRKWNHFYFDAINKWEKEGAELLEELKREAALTIENPYQRKALQPGENQTVFLGREQIRNELATTIRTSNEMPLFLIQGQRRVGKTSLLNFLQTLLGSRFVVVRMDLQSSEDCMDVPSWMESLYRKFNTAIGLQAEEWHASDHWLKSWDELSRHLLTHSKGKDFKVVVAMDEYESLHEKGLSKDPEQGGHLLGAMRSFSQHQNQVAFLFTGAALFSELENPLWSNYFVHAIRLHVGYLNEADTRQLITAPVPGFGLEYRDSLPQTIRHLTQGHPALIQMICRELVTTANHGDRRHVGQSDLDAVLKAHILTEDNGVFSVFWNQFCEALTMKETVRAILRGQAPADKAALQKLLRHEFVVAENGGYRLQTPLFEQWVRKFDLGMLNRPT